MPAPDPRPLDRAATDALLARNRVGRIAYTLRGRLEVEPVLYAFADGWVWARTSYGRAWSTPGEGEVRGTPVVFQVDEVDAGFQWRAAMVRGTLHPVEHPADGGDPALWVHAVELIRALDPAAAGDTASLRSALVRVAAHEVMGREAGAAG